MDVSTVEKDFASNVSVYCPEGDINTGLFISPSGISELDCATTKTHTA